MSILGSSWKAEGYYEDDGYGDMMFVDDPERIKELHKNGELYEHDGFGMSKVDNNQEINLNRKYK